MLQKYLALKQAHASLCEGIHDPFGVTFDEIVSPTEAKLGGATVTLFGSNNYLGLTFDPECRQQATHALAAEGTGTTGSRIANGTYSAHRALEQQIAKFLGRREAIVFTTGYQANLGMLSALAGRDDDLLLDADGHASLYDGARLSSAQITRFRHNDADDLYRRLKRLSSRPGEKLIVVEGLYSMRGDLASLREIAAVKRETGAYLMVDEAHSLGVFGPYGRGVAELAEVEADVDYVVGTFSKSLGGIGGFCAADAPDFDLLRLASRPYMFTASLPPAVVAGVSRALALVERRPELRAALLANAHLLHSGLAAAGFRLGAEPSPIVSIQLQDPATAAQLWNGLLDTGFYANLALPPATPSGQALLRMSVTAMHTAAQIEAVIASMTAIGRDLAIVAAKPAGIRHAAE